MSTTSSLVKIAALEATKARLEQELDELRAQVEALKLKLAGSEAALSIQTERVIRTESTLKVTRQELAAASARIRELKGQSK
jgi:predicted  nucleic acid-binding Zn-ribbon protein